MSAGPLRRATGLLGLLALAPIAFQFATGALAPTAAAVRAVAVALVALALGHVIQTVVRAALRRVDPTAHGATAEGDTMATTDEAPIASRTR